MSSKHVLVFVGLLVFGCGRDSSPPVGTPKDVSGASKEKPPIPRAMPASADVNAPDARLDAGAGSSAKATPDPALTIVAMNWCDNKKACVTHQGERMKAWAHDVPPKVYKGKMFDLLGVHELDTNQEGGRELMTCPGMAHAVVPWACLLFHMRDTTDGDSVTGMGDDGENGILFRSSRLMLVGSSTQDVLPVGSFLGIDGPNQRRRTLFGAKFRLESTGASFQFYSTHLSTHECNNCRIKGAEAIRKIAHERYNRGDLPPIVTGDFNDSEPEWPDDDEHLDVRREMERSFDDAGRYQDIMHVWVGRQDAFEGAPGGWRVIGYEKDDQPTQDVNVAGTPSRISDHPTIVVRVEPFFQPAATPADKVHIHRMETDGTVGLRTDVHDWSDGWTTSSVYDRGGRVFLLLLKHESGAVHLHEMQADGTVGTQTDTRDWSDGWTEASFFEVAGHDYLFLLKERDGIVHIHAMNPNGTVGPRVDERDWSSGWTTATFATIGSKTYLFLLKEGDGTVHIHAMNPNGTVGPKVDERDWSSGWTTATFGTIAGSTYLLLLKESDGTVHVHRMKADGTVGAQVEAHDWSSGWTTATFGAIAGSTYLLLLKENDGTVHVHRMKADGTVGAQVDAHDWSSGWSLASFYQVGGKTFLFLLKD